MKTDYHAKLVIYGLPTMTDKQVKRLLEWLEFKLTRKEIKQDRKMFTKRFTARLMK